MQLLFPTIGGHSTWFCGDDHHVPVHTTGNCLTEGAQTLKEADGFGH
jgi:hypothetical protein